jgi:hypothetical protein
MWCLRRTLLLRRWLRNLGVGHGCRLSAAWLFLLLWDLLLLSRLGSPIRSSLLGNMRTDVLGSVGRNMLGLELRCVGTRGRAFPLPGSAGGNRLRLLLRCRRGLRLLAMRMRTAMLRMRWVVLLMWVLRRSLRLRSLGLLVGIAVLSLLIPAVEVLLCCSRLLLLGLLLRLLLLLGRIRGLSELDRTVSYWTRGRGNPLCLKMVLLGPSRRWKVLLGLEYGDQIRQSRSPRRIPRRSLSGHLPVLHRLFLQHSPNVKETRGNPGSGCQNGGHIRRSGV